MKKINLWIAVLAVVSFAVIGCGKKESEEDQGGAATATATVDPATAGNITGKIAFEGTAPAKGDAIKMNADPNCMKMHPEAVYQEPVIVNSNNTLKNVFVYVKAGPVVGMKFPVPSTPVEIDQKGCMYSPHIFGIQVGQKLAIKNDDATLHNIHAHPAINAQFNAAEPNQGMVIEKTFDKAEVPVPFRCDVHNWMNAFAGVVDNPFWAVTGDDGSFSLKGLPPGTYTITAWQEKYGPMDQTVTIGAKETKDITITFKGQ